MKVEERLVADYAGTDLTIDKHPMYYCRIELHRHPISNGAAKLPGRGICTNCGLCYRATTTWHGQRIYFHLNGR